MLTLISSAFEDNTFIPFLYTCDGDNTHPPFSIFGIPEGTESLVLVMDDSDIPVEIQKKMGITKFNHWSLYNIPPETTIIDSENKFSKTGLNTRGVAAYTGPCPPTEYEPAVHRYTFRLYALSKLLEFQHEPTLDEIEEASQGSMLEKSELTGLYTRLNN